MSWFPESKDHLPLTWWKGTPIFLAGVIAISAVGLMVLTALLLGAAGTDAVMSLGFSANGLLHHYRIWTIFTYPLVNFPSIWLLLTSYLLYSFGTEVEKHLGRSIFVQLLLWIMLTGPVLLTLVNLVFGTDTLLIGIYGIEFGVFLAFATLYPRAQISLILFTIEVWIVAVAVVGVSLLSALASRDWGFMIQIAASAAVPYGFIRYQQGRKLIPILSDWWGSRKPKLHVVPRPGNTDGRPKRSVEEIDPRVEVDAILEKIARHGISSLTDNEKTKLEAASKRMRGKRG